MSRVAVVELLRMLDGAFDPSPADEQSQALLPNLLGVSEEMWRVPPPGGSRSIDWILFHLGACKAVGDDLAFGDGTVGYESPLASPPIADGLAAMIDWLRATQRRYREHLAALEDHQLDVIKATTSGTPMTVRGLISGTIQHDLYHAGEINVVRGLLVGDDRWPHERATAG